MICWPKGAHKGAHKQDAQADIPMIDHISIAVRDLQASAAFYQQVLEPLGYTRLVERPATVGFGMKYPEVWLNARPLMRPLDDDTGAHICLRAKTIEAVQQFHARALAS